MAAKGVRMADPLNARSDAMRLADQITRDNPDLPPPAPSIYTHRGPQLVFPTWSLLKFLFTGRTGKRERGR